MFILLLIVVFLIAVAVSAVVVGLFDKSIKQILGRIVSEDISLAWARYLKFAIYVVGISGGVRVFQLERYISKRSQTDEILQLTRARWLLEVYQTIIGTLQSIVWLMLVFFIFALIAYVVVRALETRKVNMES
jgi:hypothetical protein